MPKVPCTEQTTYNTAVGANSLLRFLPREPNQTLAIHVLKYTVVSGAESTYSSPYTCSTAPPSSMWYIHQTNLFLTQDSVSQYWQGPNQTVQILTTVRINLTKGPAQENNLLLPWYFQFYGLFLSSIPPIETKTTHRGPNADNIAPGSTKPVHSRPEAVLQKLFMY